MVELSSIAKQDLDFLTRFLVYLRRFIAVLYGRSPAYPALLRLTLRLKQFGKSCLDCIPRRFVALHGAGYGKQLRVTTSQRGALIPYDYKGSEAILH